MQSNSTDLFSHVVMKRCRRCHNDQPLSSFSIYKRAGQDYHRRVCRTCRNEYQQEIRHNGNKAPERAAIVEKQCCDCKVTKPVEDFAKQRTPIGNLTYGSVCRPCRATRSRAWHAKHGQTRARNTKFRRRFGIGLEDYNALLLSQGGVCAICCKPPTKNIDQRTLKPRRLAVDHDHATGRVRGLLCNNCNRALGNFLDDPDILLKAIKYLRLNA